jgi:uncharacterized membrane protein
MSTPASIKGHPVHPMLIALPMGLWIFALVCDVIRAAGGGPVLATVALYSIAGGIAGALVAAVPGFIDFLTIHEADMKRIAILHMSVNLGAVALFAVNLWTRFHVAGDSSIPLVLSIAGVLLIGLGGWWGGEMVYVKGMAVQTGDHTAQTKKPQGGLRRTE